jgi:hypothetical protein
MGHGYLAPAKKMRPKLLLSSLLPSLLALAWPAAASAQSCSLKLLNSVPLTVEDNAAWVPGTVGTKGGGTKEGQFQLDTAALDNQMGRDAMNNFGLSAVDYTPSQSADDIATINIGQSQGTDISGITGE